MKKPSPLPPFAALLFCAVMLPAHARDEAPAGEKAAKAGPVRVPGYLDKSAVPDSAAILPAPPAMGAPAMGTDEEINRRALALRGTPRWNQAVEDANLDFPRAAGTFACALGVAVTEKDTPRTYLMMRRLRTDAANATETAKDRHQRQRPFMVNNQPMCTPEEDARLRKGGSYPSAHSAVGWAWALAFAEAAPERGDALFARGLSYSESRVVCNVHWPSDTEAGRVMGAAAVARAHADKKFRKDLEAARREISAARNKGQLPDRDCKAEAEALATHP